MAWVGADGIYHEGDMPIPADNGLGRVVGPKPGSHDVEAQPGTFALSGNYVPLTLAEGKNAAANTTAAVLRGNYENWKTQYFPRINELMQMTSYENPQIVGQEVGEAQKQVTSAFNYAKGSQNRNMARFGLTPSARQQTAQNEALELAESTAMADASNRTRQDIMDRNRAIAAGGLPAAVSGG